MIAALETTLAIVRDMTPRRFEAVKVGGHTLVLYNLHGTERGDFIALNRNYKPLGVESYFPWVDYSDPKYTSLRCRDETGAIRALAAGINDHARTSMPGGVRVSLFVFLDDYDTKGTYIARVKRLIEVLR